MTSDLIKLELQKTGIFSKTNNSLLPLFFGLLVITIFSTSMAYGETIQVDIEGESYDIEYSGSGVTISGIEADLDFFSLILDVSVTGSDSSLDIIFDRSFFDSKYEGADDSFIILADGDEPNFVETENNSQSRTLSIEVPSGTEEIEIFGSVFGDDSSVLVIDIPEPVVEEPVVEEPVVEEPVVEEPVVEEPVVEEPVVEEPVVEEPVVEEPVVEEPVVEEPVVEEPVVEEPVVEEPVVEEPVVEEPVVEEPVVEEPVVEEPVVEEPVVEEPVVEEPVVEEPVVEEPVVEEPVVEEPVVEEPVVEEETPRTQCGPGTTLKDGVCVLDEKCGPGTILEDGVCVLSVIDTPPTQTDTSVKGLGKDMVYGAIAAFVIAGIIGIIVALMSKASKSKD